MPYPHGCRSGECGSCKCRLIAGQVRMYPYSPGALSEDERAAGLILACRSRPAGDVEVAWLGDAAPPAFHSVQPLVARVVRMEAATHDITRLYVEPAGKPLAFAAGQYANLTFGRLPARPYSMANRPDASVLEFHIRRVPDGLVSTYVAEELSIGERIKIEGPYGGAQLRENPARPMLLVAGGSGLAPMKSILLAA
ncbi:MAG: FAD-binding oxidoreductase, partial [Burkholderiales bacterium]